MLRAMDTVYIVPLECFMNQKEYSLIISFSHKKVFESSCPHVFHHEKTYMVAGQLTLYGK